MNKLGQTVGLTIISSIVIFIVGMMFLNFLMPEIATFRIEMNCASASSISDGVKLMCLVTDATVPYWILLVFSITLGAIVERFLL
jgi:hypothetical protein